MPISLLFVTNSLGIGGAEMMLYRLLSRLDRTHFTAKVVSLVDYGATPVAEKIKLLGYPVRYLGLKPGRPNIMALVRLATWLRQEPPDVIQTWMYHADLIGGLAAKLAGGIPVVWGIHNSDLGSGSKRLTRMTVNFCALLSRWLSERSVFCSECSKVLHLAKGYQTEGAAVIPNGLDLEIYKPDSVARNSFRMEWKSGDDVVIGLAARFDPQKDHHNFIEAARMLLNEKPNVRFIMCGRGVNWENRELTTWIERAGIRERIVLLGGREDLPRVLPAFDIASLSSSYGEAFPLVLIEAMSCGVPCVATDVGDSALIVGETGIVVPPRNPAALAEAWRKMVDLGPEGRCRLGVAARQRVKERFDLANIAKQYEATYQTLVDSGSHTKASLKPAC